jgi:hypothetical protein
MAAERAGVSPHGIHRARSFSLRSECEEMFARELRKNIIAAVLMIAAL